MSIVNYQLRVEPEAAHTGVEFDMDGEMLYTGFLSSVDKCLKHLEVIDLGLEVIAEERGERCEFGVHHEDSRGDAGAAKFGTFVGDGVLQVGNPGLVLVVR